MSTTHLVYDTGVINVPTGLGPWQIGPNLDIRKYAKIRVVSAELGGPFGFLIDLQVTEGGVSLPLVIGLEVPGFHTAVFDVAGRELQIIVQDIPVGSPRQLRLFVFGLEL